VSFGTLSVDGLGTQVAKLRVMFDAWPC